MNYLNDWGNEYQPKVQTWRDLKEIFKKIESWGQYKEIVKAIIAYEKCIDDDDLLEEIYQKYMDSDCSVFSDEMNNYIEGVDDYLDM